MNLTVTGTAEAGGAQVQTPPRLPIRVRQIVEFVTAYVDEHGYSPGVLEIGEGVGLQSASTVARYVRRAIMAGLLTEHRTAAYDEEKGGSRGSTARTLRPVRERCQVCGRP